jgi:hypothetical protein
MSRLGMIAAFAQPIALGCNAEPIGEHVANDDCNACHGDDDVSAELVPAHAATATRARCGDCHAQASWSPALAGEHPVAAFPLGAPHDYACLDCHDPFAGARRSDTDCVGCHDGAHGEVVAMGRHARVPDYRFDPNDPSFCLDCHARGTQP